jgi:molybdopterin-guanine dinucleotide biosynthesis protein A
MDTRYGAVVLCGGESSRMGRDKAWLPWGPDGTMLEHVVTILQNVVPTRNIAVVPGRDQQVPSLTPGVRYIGESSKTAGTGPLAAVLAGLTCSKPRLRAAFVCGCDAPLLKPAFVSRLLYLCSQSGQVVVPRDEERIYPLAAAYGRACWKPLLDAFIAGERSLHRVLRSGALDVREVPAEHLRKVDPDLDSLVNCNTPEEYEAALRRSGFPA